MRRNSLERARRVLLWPAARAWAAAARLRASLYSSGTLKRRRLPRPVVSIGNLTAGGTGKTPFVLWLFGELERRGLRAAVLTRGYRRLDSSRILLFTGGVETADPAGAGDEVQLMLRHGVAPIAVAADRYEAGAALERQTACSLYLLDDGFQHLALERDLDIVLIDSTRPPWTDELLPAGLLREPVAALRRANVLVFTRIQQWSDAEGLLKYARELAPQADVFLARTQLAGSVPDAPIATGPVLAFAGIGNPRAFFADLCVCGLQVVGTERFRDHHLYTVKDLLKLERRAREVEAEALVTTEKDAVNLPQAFRKGLELPLRVVRMELQVERGRELVKRIVEMARK